MCTGVGAEMPELNYSIWLGSNELSSVMWLATRQFKNPCSQLQKSHWKINSTVTAKYVILDKFNISSSYFTLFMLNCLEQTFKLKFDSCQILYIIDFQNNLTT